MPSSHKREFDFLVRDDYRTFVWVCLLAPRARETAVAKDAKSPTQRAEQQKQKIEKEKKNIINYYN